MSSVGKVKQIMKKIKDEFSSAAKTIEHDFSSLFFFYNENATIKKKIYEYLQPVSVR